LIVVGLSCANPNPYDRPSIWEVINMLKCWRTIAPITNSDAGPAARFWWF
jgi:hypothetical protein